MSRLALVAFVAATLALAAPVAGAQESARPPVLDVWAKGQVAFGTFVMPAGGFQRPAPGAPRTPPVYTREIGETLAANPLYDFVFLNLEGRYDAEAITAIAAGLTAGAAAGGRPALLVRIPPLHEAGEAATGARIREAFARGADGVTLPHVRSVDEARQAVALFHAAGADVWSPANRAGTKIAMLMIEDPGALAQAKEIADVKGYSVLACGIGSLTGALGGDRAAAEAGNQRILAESRRAGLVNMLTASPDDVARRVGEGFTALLGMGPSVDEMIRAGRAAAGR